MSPLDVTRYLERLGVDASASLAVLQHAHHLAVPFENLSVHWKQPIRLDEELLFEKIIGQRRGGFCFELNGLFARLLLTLGHRVTLLSGRVATEQGGFGPEFDHLTLLVEDRERWLIDVGFGDGFVEPLRLDARGVQTDQGRHYRIGEDGAGGLVLWREEPTGWEPQYAFTLTPRVLADFEGMCHFHQSSPDSIFTQRRLCTRLLPDGGRVTLKEGALVHTAGGVRREVPLPDEDAWNRALVEHFAITRSGQ